MLAFSSRAPTVLDITQGNKSKFTREGPQLDISSVTVLTNGNGCMIGLEAGEWGRLGCMVNLAVGLLEE